MELEKGENMSRQRRSKGDGRGRGGRRLRRRRGNVYWGSIIDGGVPVVLCVNFRKLFGKPPFTDMFSKLRLSGKIIDSSGTKSLEIRLHSIRG